MNKVVVIGLVVISLFLSSCVYVTVPEGVQIEPVRKEQCIYTKDCPNDYVCKEGQCVPASQERGEVVGVPVPEAVPATPAAPVTVVVAPPPTTGAAGGIPVVPPAAGVVPPTPPVTSTAEDETLPPPEIISNFRARWDPLQERKLQFTWEHSTQAEQHYIALDMWNTYNTGPLGSIASTIEDLQSGSLPFGMPSHVYEYQNDWGELYWGWNADFAPLPYLGIFRIHAYLLDSGYNVVEEVAYVQLIVNNFELAATSTAVTGGEPAPPEPAPPVVVTENTIALCRDGVDNDNDGFIDGRDSQCRGTNCEQGMGVPYWVWSYLKTGTGTYLEDASSVPARVGCVRDNQCVNIEGQPVNVNVFYNNKWICDASKDFYRCESAADVGARVGSFECRLVSKIYKWTDTTLLK